VATSIPKTWRKQSFIGNNKEGGGKREGEGKTEGKTMTTSFNFLDPIMHLRLSPVQHFCTSKIPFLF
jgi:hypothetical protein